MDALKQAVLAGLKKEAGKGHTKTVAPSRFNKAARAAWDAVKSDNGEAFTKAFGAAVRIAIAERD